MGGRGSWGRGIQFTVRNRGVRYERDARRLSDREEGIREEGVKKQKTEDGKRKGEPLERTGSW